MFIKVGEVGTYERYPIVSVLNWIGDKPLDSLDGINAYDYIPIKKRNPLKYVLWFSFSKLEDNILEYIYVDNVKIDNPLVIKDSFAATLDYNLIPYYYDAKTSDIINSILYLNKDKLKILTENNKII